jgi:serine/threonine protein kinase
MHDIALGMRYLHDKDIIHGDLNGVCRISLECSRRETNVNSFQTNVLIKDSGKACIANFGLSKLKYDALSPSTTTMGTMRFMAPERMEGNITQEGDLYSFGLLIYQVRPGKFVGCVYI